MNRRESRILFGIVSLRLCVTGWLKVQGRGLNGSGLDNQLARYKLRKRSGRQQNQLERVNTSSTQQ